MMQNSHIKYVLLAFITMMMTITAFGQLSLIDQYIYKSDTDSISVGNYLDPTRNEVLLIYPSNCDECLSDIIAYEQVIDQWGTDYDLDITILVQPHQWQFTTTSLIQQVELNTDFEVFVFNGDIDSQGSYLYSKSLRYESIIPEYLSKEDLEPYLVIMAEAESLQNDLLESNILQCAVDVSNCDEADTIFLHINDIVQVGGTEYSEVLSRAENSLLRLDAINRRMFYFDPTDSTEHLLYSLDGYVCDSIKIFSVSEDNYVDAVITDYWIDGDYEYWSTDIEMQCQDSTEPFIISTQYGTNAGLIPQFKDGKVTSKLVCHYDAGGLEYGDPENCPSDKVDQLSTLRVFPNPVRDFLFIEAGINNIEHIRMHNLRGQLIIPESKYDGPIDMSGLSSGVYFLAITSEGQLSRYRVVKY